MAASIYILRCSDGKYYVGSTRGDLERRVAEHNAGQYEGFTSYRRPVELVYSEEFDRISDAIAAERRLKGWSRAKKESYMRGDMDPLKTLAARKKKGTNR
jgi:putative endonuclease